MNKLTAGALALLISLIGMFEGLRLYAYRDPVGIPTICYGETYNVRMGDRSTKPQCDERLKQGIARAHYAVAQCITRPVPLGVLVSAVDLTYNAGPAKVCPSTFIRHVNAGNWYAACEELPKWKYAGGKVLPGLEKRREAFRQICHRGLP